MALTKIEWTATQRPDGTVVPGYTFNCWRGCDKVSPGCDNCYAETLSHRNPKTLGIWGKGGTRPVAAESYWKQPEKWDREAERAGERRRVFCLSLGDVFENRADLVWPRVRLFDLIRRTPHLDWLLLTKRPKNVLPLLRVSGERVHNLRMDDDVRTADWLDDWRQGYKPPPENVWVGTSVEDQARADERIPPLLRVPAAVRFLSMEPLLGPVDLDLEPVGRCVECDRVGRLYGHWCARCANVEERPTVDWVIVGGESGPKSRPFNLDWARSLVAQCRAADVPVFVKQLGGVPVLDRMRWLAGPTTALLSYKNRDRAPEGTEALLLNDRKGGDWEEWPEDLRVREFPASAVPVP